MAIRIGTGDNWGMYLTPDEYASEEARIRSAAQKYPQGYADGGLERALSGLYPMATPEQMQQFYTEQAGKPAAAQFPQFQTPEVQAFKPPAAPADPSGVLKPIQDLTQQFITRGQAGGQDIYQTQQAAAPILVQMAQAAVQQFPELGQDVLIKSILDYQGMPQGPLTGDVGGIQDSFAHFVNTNTAAGIPEQQIIQQAFQRFGPQLIQTIMMNPQAAPPWMMEFLETAVPGISNMLHPQPIVQSGPSDTGGQQRQVITQGPEAPPNPFSVTDRMGGTPPAPVPQTSGGYQPRQVITQGPQIQQQSSASQQRQVMSGPPLAPKANIFKGQFASTPMTAQPGQTQASFLPNQQLFRQQDVTSPYWSPVLDHLVRAAGGGPQDVLTRLLMSGGNIQDLLSTFPGY